MKITQQQKQELARQFGISLPMLQAFLEVESAGSGFFTDWKGQQRIKIQFEPHWFKRLLPADLLQRIYALWEKQEKKQGKLTETEKLLLHNWQIAVLNKVDVQQAEWQAFNCAYAIHPDTAMQSASWGLGQVMGFHYKDLGFKTAAALVEAFKQSEYEQVKGMLTFCQKKKGLMEAMQARNWDRVAFLYNGPKYAEHGYQLKLAKAYSKYEKHQRMIV
ncbi:N-acetylmuramidase family protein [Pontibacter burrus]|uniref:N-acetylmuramidase family protein n=1 Tax=Pontibacter burrus TaxID=2704466 RepID=A0A6B3LQ79_9BACT|nr:N-acetylmuramidase family protein [Pontibacter burrus]NEM96148.1 N-acetylmuramidase family protein [Pontibacter burrus]